MSGRLTGSVAVLLAALLLGGCSTYDYLQRTDRVSYHAGDAVKANLERETLDPSNAAMYDTSGLGRNGSVMPKAAADSGDAASPSSAEPTAGAEAPTAQ